MRGRLSLILLRRGCENPASLPDIRVRRGLACVLRGGAQHIGRSVSRGLRGEAAGGANGGLAASVLSNKVAVRDDLNAPAAGLIGGAATAGVDQLVVTPWPISNPIEALERIEQYADEIGIEPPRD